jgi:hypothetical protein
VADVVAVASTIHNDGIVRIPADGGPGTFAVAVTNAGAAADITVSADAGGLPVAAVICSTEADTAACLAPPAPSVTLRIGAGATSTFAVFVTSAEFITFDPAYHRVKVHFSDPGGVTRGLTSVAVQTIAPEGLPGQ